jgi:Cof subfamily protein (haloacid dehalogenase superfamily)
MPRFKLVALDLDGTLLNSSLKLSDGNGAMLRRAIDAGVLVILATSRWHGLARRTADRLEITTPIISSNGALAKLPADGSELLHLYVDPECAREVVTLGDDSGWEMYTTVGDATYMKMRPGVIPERLPAGLRVAERQCDHLDDGRPTCVMAFGPDAVKQIEDRFVHRYGDRVTFSINHPGGGMPPYWVMTHPEADKGAALKLVCEHLGVAPDEAFAMGDSESDLGMLAWAGLGVAMSNGSDAAKRAALHIAPPNDADGVAWAIERFVL